MTNLDASVSSKPRFVSSTVGMILGLFLVGHVGLVAVYQWGTFPTFVTAVACSAAVAALFIWRRDHRFFPLLAGTALWAIVGEIAEHLGYLTIVDFRFIAVLLPCIAVFAWLVGKHRLPFFPAVTSCLFLGVWASHFVMVNMFEAFGKRDRLTYASSLLFVGILFLRARRMKKTRSRLGLTIGAIVCTCCCWSLLEYLWAWKVIPKPW